MVAETIALARPILSGGAAAAPAPAGPSVEARIAELEKKKKEAVAKDDYAVVGRIKNARIQSFWIGNWLSLEKTRTGEMRQFLVICEPLKSGSKHKKPRDHSDRLLDHPGRVQGWGSVC